jgi:hypothetical protein
MVSTSRPPVVRVEAASAVLVRHRLLQRRRAEAVVAVAVARVTAAEVRTVSLIPLL